MHGLPSNWSSFNDDTLLEKAVSHQSPLDESSPVTHQAGLINTSGTSLSYNVVSFCLQGNAVVMVEHRSGSSDAYGQGRKGPMALKDLITHLQRGNSDLYMSTQEVGQLACRASHAHS